MRERAAAALLVAVMTACARAPFPESPHPDAFSVQPLASRTVPSPLSEVQAGYVRAVVPTTWEAKPLPPTRVAQQGFVASPRLDRFRGGDHPVQGVEAFWVDLGKVRIPSDYYYLAARNQSLAALSDAKSCQLARRNVFADNPPDFTGKRFSRSDYVASATGTCSVRGWREPLRWAYVVAAPGYGPVRRVGIPSSGLYVFIAVVSGPNADVLLKRMVESARFGRTPISQIVRAAGAAA